MPNFRYPIRSVVVGREDDDGNVNHVVELARYPIGTGNSSDDKGMAFPKTDVDHGPHK